MPKTRVSLGDWPRLTRFYGITPMELQHLPHDVLEVYAEQLPELYAQEVLDAILAATMPHATEGDRKRITTNLSYMAGYDEIGEDQKIDVRTEGGRARAASLGIGVELPLAEPPTEDDEDA